MILPGSKQTTTWTWAAPACRAVPGLQLPKLAGGNLCGMQMLGTEIQDPQGWSSGGVAAARRGMGVPAYADNARR